MEGGLSHIAGLSISFNNAMEGNLRTFIKIINVPPFVPEILLLGICPMVSFMQLHKGRDRVTQGLLVLIVPGKKQFKCPPISDFFK